MQQLTANDLKTKGVAAIEASLEGQTEVVVSVRGKDKYVVMDLAQYHYLRECELEAALAESRTNITEGKFVQESAEAHLIRLNTLNQP